MLRLHCTLQYQYRVGLVASGRKCQPECSISRRRRWLCICRPGTSAWACMFCHIPRNSRRRSARLRRPARRRSERCPTHHCRIGMPPQYSSAMPNRSLCNHRNAPGRFAHRNKSRCTATCPGHIDICRLYKTGQCRKRLCKSRSGSDQSACSGIGCRRGTARYCIRKR